MNFTVININRKERWFTSEATYDNARACFRFIEEFGPINADADHQVIDLGQIDGPLTEDNWRDGRVPTAEEMAAGCSVCGMLRGDHYMLCPRSADYYSPERERSDALMSESWPTCDDEAMKREAADIDYPERFDGDEEANDSAISFDFQGELDGHDTAEDGCLF